MPSAAGPDGTRERRGFRRPDIVVGDRYGTSCDSRYVECVENALRRRGYKVQRNKPYAGGYITEYFGSISRSCDALQIEVNRGLYMDERTLERLPGFDKVAADMSDVIGELERLVAADLAAPQGQRRGRIDRRPNSRAGPLPKKKGGRLRCKRPQV